MTEPYTPTTEEIRFGWSVYRHDPEWFKAQPMAGRATDPEFDRWLAKLKADTLAPVFALHKPLKVWESDRVCTIVCAECKLKAYPCPTVLAITEEDHEME